LSGEYSIKCDLIDETGKNIITKGVRWKSFIKSERKELDDIVDTKNKCTLEQINRNNYYVPFLLTADEVSKMRVDSSYTLVLRVKGGQSTGLYEYLDAISTDDDEAGPGEGKTFGVAQLLKAISEVPSFTDWTLLEYSYKFKFE
jgi:hypothetical protein